MADMLTGVVRELQRQRVIVELILILDVGGAGLLWSEQTAELYGRLTNEGAFRSVTAPPG